MIQKLKSNLQKAIQRKKQQTNRKRSEREFQAVDWVFLKLQSYRQTTVERRKVEKLSPMFFGPYEIISKVRHVAYTLKLPKNLKVHPTFHVSLLKQYHGPSIAQVHIPKDLEDTIIQQELAKILDPRLVQKRGKAVT